MHDNQALSIEDAKRLPRESFELLAGADIIGLRAFGPNPSDVQIRKISQAIDRKDLRGALGTLQFGGRAVKNGGGQHVGNRDYTAEFEYFRVAGGGGADGRHATNSALDGL